MNLGMISILRYTIAGLIILQTAFAGITGKIAGRVVDANTGNGLAGVNLVLQDQAVGVAADADGYYTIINIPPGRYTLIATMIGYAQLTVEDVVVNVDRTTRQDLAMGTEVIEGQSVTIIANRPLVERSLTSTNYYVDSETIESLPVTEMTEILSVQAGVITGVDGELHFRGGREREVAYLVDGIPVSNSFSQEGGFNVMIENTDIQELQVLSGTFNAEYGSAQSGIVNIITKRPARELHGSVKYYMGDFVSNKTDLFLGIDQINPFSESDLQASLTGALLSDKLGFRTTVRYNQNNSHHGYERRFNPVDGWKIDAYRKWYAEHFSEDLATTGRIHIPDSLMTGNGEVGPLDESDNLSYSAKLSYYFSPTLSFTYSLYGSNNVTQEGGLARRYQPDDLATSREFSALHFFSIKQSLGERFFWNLDLSYQHNYNQEYYRKDNKIADYPGDVGIQPITETSYGYSLGTTGGGYYGQDGKDYRKTYLVSGDINYQVNRFNFLKAGFSVKRQDVNTYELPLVETEAWSRYYYTPAINGANYEWPEYWDTMVDYWRNWNAEYDTTKYRFPEPDEVTRYRDYTIEPLEAAFYIQDVLEVDDFILNAGLRFDIFQPNEKVIVNKRVESYLIGRDENLEDAEIIYQLSPRLGFAFPISDRGAFHAAYGHFFQMPSLEKMYNEPINELTRIQLEGMRLGDASLKPEKTISYEIGLQQEIASGYAVDVTAYSKDIRNQLGIELITTVDAVGYERFVNRDYGQVKGFTVALEKLRTGFFWGSIDYTLQFAKGSSSSPEFLQVVQVSNRLGGAPVQFVERQILPLDWDQRHTASMILSAGKPGNWIVTLLGTMGSGLPYSPTSVEQLELPDRDFKNSARKPVRWNIDLKATKTFKLNNLTYSIYLMVDNIFDHLNEMDVYETTGRATNIAILPDEKRFRDEAIAQEGIFTPDEVDVRPYWFSPPRKVRLSLEVSF